VLIIPAIDLIDGRAVRLEQGDFGRVTEFSPDPVDLARRYAAAGATWLHVVDLDGAKAGRWQHLEVITRIAAAVSVPVQAGGGARTPALVKAALDRGVARVIVGSAAAAGSVEDLGDFINRFGRQLVFSLDTRNGKVLTDGWQTASATDLPTLARRLADAGATRFIHTETSRDGMLRGVDLLGLSALLPLGVPVLVAGGVATYRDLQQIRDAGAEGAIVGRAFLDGTIDFHHALTIAAAREPRTPAQ